MKSSLSVIIPALNEAENISECIQSIGNIADEILVLDNFSGDQTVDLARSSGVKVHQRPFDNYSSNKNAAIELSSCDWILLLDADERLTPDLRKEILNILASPSAEAFAIPRETFFCGIKVRCWSGQSVIRLFQRGKAKYDPSKLVHEALIVQGRVGALQNSLEHYTFRSFQQYLPKIDHFTTLAAKEAFQKQQRTGWMSLLLYPPIRFLKTYLIRGGILDGIPGLLISFLSAYSIYLKHAKLWELQRSNGR